MPVEDRLTALLVRHCASAKGEIAAIDDRLNDAQLQNEYSYEVVQEVLELVHKLNGTSGSLGFHDLSQAAAQLEGLLKDVTTSTWPPLDFKLAEIHKLYAVMKTSAKNIRPETSSLYGFDLKKLGSSRIQ